MGDIANAENRVQNSKMIVVIYSQLHLFQPSSHLQLNRGEGRHRLARDVFYRKRSELRQRYREGQEDQLGGLGLVVNIIVL
jgi:TnpA family transposase